MHVPNLVVAHTMCNECDGIGVLDKPHCVCGVRCSACNKWDNKKKKFSCEPCNTCGVREVVCRGPNTANEFGNWLFKAEHSNAVCLAHNAKGYDAYFLLEYLLNNTVDKIHTLPKVIFAGSKIMSMSVDKFNMKIIDSLNFLGVKLSALPKMFNLTEMHKGYFCHFFNTEANADYLGPLPAPKYYGPDQMSTSERAAFYRWYEERNKTTFYMRYELLAYCRNDVDILLKASSKFRSLLIEYARVDPFKQATLASTSMAVFRTNFLEERLLIKLKGDDKT